MPELSLIAVCSLVIYRVTRFLLRDTLIDEPREWLYSVVLGDDLKKRPFRDKLYELLDCKFCLGIWISAATVAVADYYTSVPLPVFTWLACAAGAMIVWRIVETDEE